MLFLPRFTNKVDSRCGLCTVWSKSLDGLMLYLLVLCVASIYEEGSVAASC
jgi:hypothetical protein